MFDRQNFVMCLRHTCDTACYRKNLCMAHKAILNDWVFHAPDLAKFKFLDYQSSSDYHLDIIAILETLRAGFPNSELDHFCGG